MKKVLIYAGTTEGRMLAEQLAAEHIPCHVCVATAYGQLVMPKMDGVEVTTGRLDIARMRQLASEMTAENENVFAAVVDSTHPFATEVSGISEKVWRGWIFLIFVCSAVAVRRKRKKAGQRSLILKITNPVPKRYRRSRETFF